MKTNLLALLGRVAGIRRIRQEYEETIAYLVERLRTKEEHARHQDRQLEELWKRIEDLKRDMDRAEAQALEMSETQQQLLMRLGRLKSTDIQ